MTWQESSYSKASDCVRWRKATRSGSNADCVEVADGVMVRDSKDPDGPVLAFSPAAWQAFLTRTGR
jgi:hypothetical protein